MVALDKYPNAPAMQGGAQVMRVSMLDGETAEVIEAERPDFIIPEIEAIGRREVDLKRRF